MNIQTYIEMVGDEEAARRFGVKTRTAASWRRGERSPRPTQIPAILAGSDGDLTIEGIYESHKAA